MMPELPEVETVRRGLQASLCGASVRDVVVRETRLRLPVREGQLARQCGSVLRSFRRFGKYLALGTDRDSVILLHLGMSGTLRLFRDGTPFARHDHVVWWLEGGRLGRPTQLRYRDPRRFGLVIAMPLRALRSHALLRDLGPDPIRDLRPGDLFQRSRGCRRPVKSFLMDPRVVAGIGNIYACESLWWGRTNPRVAAGRIGRIRWDRLQESCRQVLERAIAEGGTTLSDFRDSTGARGYFAVDLRVYGREGQACERCSRTIRRIVQAGRSTFYCPGCQF